MVSEANSLLLAYQPKVLERGSPAHWLFQRKTQFPFHSKFPAESRSPLKFYVRRQFRISSPAIFQKIRIPIDRNASRSGLKQQRFVSACWNVISWERVIFGEWEGRSMSVSWGKFPKTVVETARA